MDNEKMNERELDTQKSGGEDNSASITAEELIKRLRLNLAIDSEEESVSETESVLEAQSEAVEQAEDLIEESIASEETDVVSEAVEASDTSEGDDVFVSLEDAAELIHKENEEKKSSVTDSIKSLIAGLKEQDGSVIGDEEFEKMIAEESDQLTFEENEDSSTTVEAMDVKAEKEYSVVIESTSDKTNVFDPAELKKLKKLGEKESMFEEAEQPAVAEAEQLTFSMTEDDVQKSIEEAEAFIFEREYIDNPEEVINDTEVVAEENAIEAPDKKEEEYDQTDLWIASAFGDEDEIKNMYGEEEAQKIETQLDLDVQEYLNDDRKNVKNVKISEDYTPHSDKKEIFAEYRKMHKLSLVKLAGCLLLLIVAFIYENLSAFGGTLPGALNQQNYPVVYILGSLQLLVLAGALAWEQISKGVRSILAMRPLPESITAVVAVTSVLYHIAHCFISETDPEVALYVFPVILCIFVTLIYDFLCLKREIYTFNVISSKRLKYTINHIDSDNAGLENEAFGEYLAEEQEVSMFKIGKTSFVNGFYKRMNAYAKSNSSVTLLISVAIALGLVFFIVSSVVYDIRTAFSFGYLAFVLAVPGCSLLAFGLPFYRASKRAFADGSAIVGEAALEEYSSANTLSFDDKDVFPSYGVKIKSIKVYGDSRIDKILYNGASVFKVIGGPLGDVFETATHDLGSSEDLEIIELAKDCVEALIDGDHVYIGKTSYIKAKGFAPIAEPEDEELETSGEASIMYMISNDEVAAKMYVQYAIDPDFEFALKRLYKAGICIGIKTFDPNIDDKLLGSKVKITKYPVRILRCKTLEEATVTQDEADSGVVSKSGPRSLLNAFVLCSKVLYANRTNNVVKVLSVGASVLLMAILLVFGKAASIPSIYVVLYQLFWMVPVYLFSKLYV